jgi:hypothetical protein
MKIIISVRAKKMRLMDHEVSIKKTRMRFDNGKSEEETLLGNFKVYRKIIKEKWVLI